MAQFAARLSETAQPWRRSLAPLAEFFARVLWPKIPTHARYQPIATRLTQRRRCEAKGVLPEPPRHGADDAGSFIDKGTKDQALTLLHGLGHEMDDLFGTGTAAISNEDSPLIDVHNAMSMFNTTKITNDCFGKGTPTGGQDGRIYNISAGVK